MATSIFPDPLQLWRDAITKLEADVNALATGSLKAPDTMRSIHQVTTAGLGMQQVFEKVIEAYLRLANLPSRKDLIEVTESLQRIEQKIDRLLPADDAVPRPARTRRPLGTQVPPPAADEAPTPLAKTSRKPATTKGTKAKKAPTARPRRAARPPSKVQP